MLLFVIQIINMSANVIRILVSRPIGKYSDKTSYAKGYKLGLYFAAGAFLINVFTTRDTRLLIILFTILFYICLAGINQNSYNISYSYVKSEYITYAMAFKNSIAGTCGFVSSVIAGKILGYIQSNGSMLFGIHIYGQQVLSAVSFIITIITIIFITNIIEKQEVMVQ